MADGNRGRPEGGAGAVTWRGRGNGWGRSYNLRIRPGLGLHALLNFLEESERNRLSSCDCSCKPANAQIRLRNDLSGSHSDCHRCIRMYIIGN